MKNFSILAAGLCALLAAGCAGKAEKAQEQSSANILRENEKRLISLEDSVSALNTQLAQLNNRVYEVRTRNGQKTSMTVVPVISPGATTPISPAPQPAVQATAPKTAPTARKIDPAKAPAPLPTRQPAATPKPATQARAAGSAGQIGNPSTVAGPSGQLAGSDGLGLPPAELPSEQAVPVPRGNVTPVQDSTPVPIPLVAEGSLSLPPENTAVTPAASPAPAPQAPAAPRSAPTAKGEEAAYKAALNAVRSGRTAEGINLFNNFLSQYPNSKYTANADYWIGECLYSQGKYQDALSSFQTVNNSFPNHHKNADALLKAGITLNRLGDKAGAAEKFRSLIANFPNSDAAKRARAMGVAH